MLLTGGCSKSAVWRRIFCDIFNMPVLKTNVDQDAASLGAAALAAVAVGVWPDYSGIPAIHVLEDRLEPDAEAAAYYEQLLPVFDRWTHALADLSEELTALRK